MPPNSGYDGENALPVCYNGCSDSGLNQIVLESSRYGPIHAFTYLRMDSQLLSYPSWPAFTNFVSRMHSI